MVSRASLISKAFGKSGALASVAEASTPVADRKLSSAALAPGVGGGTTLYPNFASFPSSGNTAGDFGFDTDFQAVYMWDGTEWDRIYTDTNAVPEWTTTPPSTANLASDGTATNQTVVASDPEGFPITYTYDIFSNTTLQ